jgi:hypothetical protein
MRGGSSSCQRPPPPQHPPAHTRPRRIEAVGGAENQTARALLRQVRDLSETALGEWGSERTAPLPHFQKSLADTTNGLCAVKKAGTIAATQPVRRFNATRRLCAASPPLQRTSSRGGTSVSTGFGGTVAPAASACSHAESSARVRGRRKESCSSRNKAQAHFLSRKQAATHAESYRKRHCPASTR